MAGAQLGTLYADAPLGGPVSFPTSRLTFRIRLGVGASYTVPADLSADWHSWNWVDITRFVRYGDGIDIRVGKTERSDVVVAGDMTLRLDNRASSVAGETYPQAGRFARRNPNSGLFGLLTRNTPIWVEVNPGSGFVTLAQMFVNEWPTRWADESATDSTVTVTCSGLLHRLEQASEARSPLRRAIMQKGVAAPVLYLPGEDGPNTTDPQLVYGDSVRIPKPRLVTFGDTNTVAGKAQITVDLTPQPDEPTAASLAAVRVRTFLTVSSAPSYVKIGFTFRGDLASTPLPTMAVVDVRIFNAFGGTSSFGSFTMFANWDTVTNDFTDMGVQWVGQGGQSSADTNWNPFDGREHYIEIKLIQNSANTDQELRIDNILHDSNSYANVLDTPTELWLRPGAGTLGGDTVDNTGVTVNFSNITLYTSSSAPDLGIPGTAGVGEEVNDRAQRVCAEDGVALRMTDTASGSPAMGPQPVASLVELLRDCETVGQGVVYEAGFELGYQTRSERENQPPWLALNFDSRHISGVPSPADDDRDTRNKWTVTRPSGSEYTSELTTGPMGTGSEGPGFLADSTESNVETDDLLVQQATYRVWRDTVDADRWPDLALNLMSATTATYLIPLLTTMPYGARVTLASPPTGVAPDTIDVIADGVSQALTLDEWRASLMCFPNAVANHVFRLAADSGDADEFLGYLTFDSCVLAEDLDTTETGVDVTTSGAFWETAVDNWTPGALVVVDGETMLVTGVAGKLSDTFARGVTDGWGTATPSGQTYTLLNAPATDFDVNGANGTIQPSVNGAENIAYVDVGSTDVDVYEEMWISALPASGNLRAGVAVRLVDSGNYQSVFMLVDTAGAITLFLQKRVSASTSTVTSVTIPGTYVAGAKYALHVSVVGQAHRARLWPLTASEPAVWHIDTTTDANPGGTKVGAFARNSSAVTTQVFSFDNLQTNNPQTLTVTRSVNGVVKAHSSGATVDFVSAGALGL